MPQLAGEISRTILRAFAFSGRSAVSAETPRRSRTISLTRGVGTFSDLASAFALSPSGATAATNQRGDRKFELRGSLTRNGRLERSDRRLHQTWAEAAWRS